MSSPPQDELKDFARAAGEATLGAAILTIRRLNIFRQEDNPAAQLVDAGMDALGDAIPEASAVVADAMMVASVISPEPVRDKLLQGRDLVAQAPQVARMAGLTPTTDQD